MAQLSKNKPARRTPTCTGCLDVNAARFFKALCDPNRLAMLARLAQCGRPCTVSEIAKHCPIDLSVVSRHLGILRDAGVVTAMRRGKEVHYLVRFDVMVSTLREIADTIEACCPGEKNQCTENRRRPCRP